MRTNVLVYSKEEFNFVQVVEHLFDTNELCNLHKLTDQTYDQLFEIGHDSSTEFHKLFYDRLHQDEWPEMQNLYDRFIEQVVAPWYLEDFLYQKFPTFRVHLPGNVAVGKFHKDADFGHPKGEINFILPLTYSDYTASVWVESQDGKGDFRPMNMNVGELIMFNGNILTHGNKVNKENETRVSMDFRILPISRYKEEEAKQSITTSTKFVEGKYYKRFSK